MAQPVSRRSFVIGGASLVPCAFFARVLAQESPTFYSDVNVVNVFAAVHDKQGKAVRNLTREAFTLEDEGRPQNIRYFSQQSDLSLTLGLLVDTSGSQRNVLGEERRASLRFLEQVMRPEKDQTFVIHFDDDIELLQDVTSSRKELEESLDDIDLPELNHRLPGQGPGGRRFRGGGTNLYDALLLASDDMMMKQQGRKALFVLSDGVDTGSRVTLNDSIESAQRADTLVYAIRFFDQNMSFAFSRRGGIVIGGRRRRGPVALPPNYPDGKKVLQRMAEETGGGYFEVSEKRTLSDIYSAIEEELRSQYSLGFTPQKSSPGYHKLRVGMKDKNLIAQARSGYYSR